MFKKSTVAATVATVLAAPAVFAAEGAVDYSALTSSADFSGVSTAILAVAASLAGVLVVVKGARLVLGFFGR